MNLSMRFRYENSKGQIIESGIVVKVSSEFDNVVLVSEVQNLCKTLSESLYGCKFIGVVSYEKEC